jgi:type IV secretory pathway VirJ component
VVEPPKEVRGVVIFFSDRKGLTPADDAAAHAIAQAGAMVAEVDARAYMKSLDKLHEQCHQPAFDAEWFSRQLQRERGLHNYLTPILAGVGDGGTLAEMTLAGAPAATIAGAISIDPFETLEGRRPICATPTPKRRRRGFQYGAIKTFPGFWSVGLTRNVSKTNRKYVIALKREGSPFELQEINASQSIGDALRMLIEPHLRPLKQVVAKGPIADISALPLTILGVGHPSNLMAIVISGDGGWRDLDKTIAESLQRDGVPVVGWDSLRYFWSLKTPQQTADALAAVMAIFMAKWHADKVALIGYSFGADVMPFAYNRLPADLRSHVALIALLGFSLNADFEITVSGWMGEPPGPNAIAVIPETDKIPSSLIQCFFGQDEGDSACPTLAKRGVEVIKTTGGHHFDGDYEALARRILAGFKRRAGAS